MPKRRVPGHLQRRARRRDDARPNIPPTTRPVGDEPAASAAEAPSAPLSASVPAGRPLRPTQRASSGTRFVRSAAPPPEMEVDYQSVVGDLRQIGILALLAFAVLIVLAFVIH
jgi:hypothetical protein